MCSHSTPSYSAPKVDPAPTNVNTENPIDTESAQTSQRRKRGRNSNSLSSDRTTILSSLANNGDRNTLG